MEKLRERVAYKLLSELLPRDLVDDLVDGVTENYVLQLEAFGRKLGFRDLHYVFEAYREVKVYCHPVVYFFVAAMNIDMELPFSEYVRYEKDTTLFYKEYFDGEVTHNIDDPDEFLIESYRPLPCIVRSLYWHVLEKKLATELELVLYGSMIKDMFEL